MAGTSFTRQSSMSDGDTITAALFNNEFNQLLNAFSYASSGTTGHQHDGGAGEGGNIEIIGDQDFLNKIVVDGTNNRWGFFVQVSSSAVEQIRVQDGAIVPVTDNDIPQPTETAITNILLPSLFGSGIFGTSQFGGSTDPMVRKTITGSGHAANFRIRSSDQKSSYSINGMYIDYVPSGRR